MKTFSIALGAVTWLIASSAGAAEMTIPVTGAQVVTCAGGGAAVVLSVARPDIPSDVSLGEARLNLAGEVVSDTQDLRVHVQALSAPWSGGVDAPVIDGLVGRLDVAAGSVVQGVDVGNLVRGILAEPEFEGLLVTPAEQQDAGFADSDAQAVLAAFQGATLELSYRPVPPAPSAEGDSDGRAHVRRESRSTTTR